MVIIDKPRHFSGLSTDTKPCLGMRYNEFTFTETDTKKDFIYLAKINQWNLLEEHGEDPDKGVDKVTVENGENGTLIYTVYFKNKITTKFTVPNINALSVGYYYENKFYSDILHTTEIFAAENKLYFDLISEAVYYYANGSYIVMIEKTEVPPASEDTPGAVRLYNELGENTDGTVTQQVVTETIKEIAITLDEDDQDCLVLSLPA